MRIMGRKRFLIAPSTLAFPLVTQAMKLLTTLKRQSVLGFLTTDKRLKFSLTTVK